MTGLPFANYDFTYPSYVNGPAGTQLGMEYTAKVAFTFLPWTRLSDVLRHWQDASKLTTLVDGEPRIVSDPPLIVPLLVPAPVPVLVMALFPMLGGAFSIGQPLPYGYQSYNVPYAYRSLYYDTPDYAYRYGDGAIYRVDPDTQLISAVGDVGGFVHHDFANPGPPPPPTAAPPRRPATPQDGDFGDFEDFDDDGQYRAVTIWCKRFSVNFGTAPLMTDSMQSMNMR